jgi:hypothetical protein
MLILTAAASQSVLADDVPEGNTGFHASVRSAIYSEVNRSQRKHSIIRVAADSSPDTTSCLVKRKKETNFAGGDDSKQLRNGLDAGIDALKREINPNAEVNDPKNKQIRQAVQTLMILREGLGDE